MPCSLTRSYQCEQTLHGTGCTDVPSGVCGKTSEVANLQDLLTFQLKGLSAWAHFAHQHGLNDTAEVDSFVKAGAFACHAMRSCAWPVVCMHACMHACMRLHGPACARR